MVPWQVDLNIGKMRKHALRVVGLWDSFAAIHPFAQVVPSRAHYDPCLVLVCFAILGLLFLLSQLVGSVHPLRVTFFSKRERVKSRFLFMDSGLTVRKFCVVNL